MSANDLVAAGAPVQAKAGDVFSPSAVCCLGIGCPALIVGLVTVSAAGATWADALMAVTAINPTARVSRTDECMARSICALACA